MFEKGFSPTNSAEDPNIAEQKRRVEKGIVDLGKAFVIFIDDLDRLPPKEVFSVIRLVKAVSDFPQVAYVLAFDPLYVESALEGAGVSGGRAYLDKIVQIRVPLPPIGLAQIGKLVDREVETLEVDQTLQPDFDDESRVPQVYHRHIKFLLRTPRDVYRVFNRLRLLYPAVRTDIGLADFLALETIAITAPPLYDHIRERPEAYAGPLEEEIFQKPRKVVEQLKEERQAALDDCPVAIRGVLEKLVSMLFPMTSTGADRGPPRTTGRVANSRNLLIALSGGLPPREMSLEKVRAFVESNEHRRAIASNVAEEEQLEDFLDLLQHLLETTPVEDSANLVEALSYIGELDVVKDINKKRGFFKTDIATQVFWVLRTLLERSSSIRRKELIGRIIRDPKMLVLSVDLTSFLRWQHGIPKEKTKQPEPSCFVTTEELEDLALEWVDSMKEAFLSGSGWSSNEAGPALFLLASTDNAVAQEVVSVRLAAGSGGEDEVARTIGSGNWDSDKGEFANLSEESLGRFAEVELLRGIAEQRLARDAVLESDLSAIYTSILKGTKEYFCNHGREQ